MGKRITPRPSAEPIRVQGSDSNTAVIVVAGQKVAQDAECRAAGDTDPVRMLGMRPGQERDASLAMTSSALVTTSSGSSCQNSDAVLRFWHGWLGCALGGRS